MTRNGWFAMYMRGSTGALGAKEELIGTFYSEGFGSGANRVDGEDVVRSYLYYFASSAAGIAPSLEDVGTRTSEHTFHWDSSQQANFGPIKVRYEYLGAKLIPAMGGRVA